MGWRVARSVSGIIAEVNAAAPKRSRKSDGTKGDPAHATRESDHNPNAKGVVCAVDLTHDPEHGADMAKLSELLVAIPHPALKYVIFHGRIASRTKGWKWLPYKGTNPHNHHMHVSVGPMVYDDTSYWGAGLAWRPPTQLATGTRGDQVKLLQRLLHTPQTGVVDARTLSVIHHFQNKSGLKVDGVVGPKTWSKLLK